MRGVLKAAALKQGGRRGAFLFAATEPLIRALPLPSKHTPSRPSVHSEWAQRRVGAHRAEAARVAAATAAGQPAWPLLGASEQPPPQQQQQPPPLGVIGWHHYGSTWHGADKGKAFGAAAAAAGRAAAALLGDAARFVEVECAAREAPQGQQAPAAVAARRQRRLQQQQGNSTAAPNTPSPSPSPSPAPPPAPAPAPRAEPPPFVCEEFVADALAGGACAALVITDDDGDDGSAGERGAAAAAEEEEGAKAPEDAAAADGEMPRRGAPLDARLARRLRRRGCLVVHVGPGAEAPAALREQPSEEEQKQQQKQQRPAGELVHIRAALAPATQRLARPPRLSLADALAEAGAAAAQRLGLVPDLARGEGARAPSSSAAAEGDGAASFALLQLSCGARSWDALAALAGASDASGGGGGGDSGSGGSSSTSGQRLPLAAVENLILEAPARLAGDHRAAAAYGLLYQRLGFAGYLHQSLGPRGLRLGWVRRPRPRAAVRTAVLLEQ